MNSQGKSSSRNICGVDVSEPENSGERERERALRVAVCDAVRSCAAANGWSLLARVGDLLRERGIAYEGKLGDYLRTPIFRGLLEFSTEGGGNGCAVYYVRCGTVGRGKIRPVRGAVSGGYVLTAADVRALAENPEPIVTNDARDFLSENFVRFDEKTQAQMAGDLLWLAKRENWAFGRKNPGTFCPILKEYLLHTLFFLASGGNAAQGDRFLVFNTGLRSRIDAPIFLVLQKNDERHRGEPPWTYSDEFSWERHPFFRNAHGGFCTPADEIAEAVEADILKWPAPADFGNTEPDEFLPDTDPAEIFPEFNFYHWRHIVLENAVRLPEHILREFPPASMPPPPPGATLSEDERAIRRRRLGAAIAADKDCFTYLRGRIEASVSAAVEDVKIGAVKIVPAYYPLKKRISWLFPLSFGGSGSAPELALVTERELGGNGRPHYIARTIFPLAWAYRAARVIGRPDCDWLDPAKIEDWRE